MERPSSRRLLGLALVAALSSCTCEPNTLLPSRNTVNPATHEPYQLRQPLTTGNPMSSTGPQRVGPNDDAPRQLRKLPDPPPHYMGPPDVSSTEHPPPD